GDRHLQDFSVGIGNTYRPNRTATLDPGATLVPAGGDCSRATPLPIASNSSPMDWVTSSADRNGFPSSRGTAIPDSSGTTAVPDPCCAGKTAPSTDERSTAGAALTATAAFGLAGAGDAGTATLTAGSASGPLSSTPSG